MGSTLKEKMAALPKERQEKIEARAVELIAEEMTLQELRNKLNLTQAHMAELLGIRQEGISRLEKRTDMLLSTLRTYVESMGGDLELVVKFPELPPVRLREVSEMTIESGETARNRRSKSRRSLAHA
ncbi:MAG: XRE family transcriptional regulator [Gemmatimonadaceae bacterium]|nr:XRE family transcriptional regulator [Gloeobacterales cyanobacterium ES-bin-141]